MEILHLLANNDFPETITVNFEHCSAMFNTHKFVIWQKINLFFYTISTAVKKLTVHSSTTNKVNRISNHFWDRRRHEYVINLRETQPTSKLNINSTQISTKYQINANDIVLIYVEKVPRHF